MKARYAAALLALLGAPQIGLAQYPAPAVVPAPAPVVAPQPGGQPAVDTPQQAKLMARRAAISDAQRQLAETVFGVRIDSQTTVRDFVTESDTIYSSVQAVIRGAEVTDTRYLADGIVEVDMELPVYRVQTVLGRPFAYSGDVFRATGTGVPNAVRPSLAPLPPPAQQPAYNWAALIISATGTGAVPPNMAGTGQGYAMAKRAAQLDAYRQLGENVMGVRIDSQTYVRDYVTQSDDITARFNGFIRGARITEVRELPDGIVEVTMEIALDSLGNILLLPRQPTPRQPAAPAAIVPAPAVQPAGTQYLAPTSP